jgi:hypothetical protein
MRRMQLHAPSVQPEALEGTGARHHARAMHSHAANLNSPWNLKGGSGSFERLSPLHPLLPC